MFAQCVKSYHFNGPRSFNFIFNQENLPFSPKISAELRSKLVHVTTKQVDAREIDSLSGEPLLVIYMALQQSRHKWWLF